MTENDAALKEAIDILKECQDFIQQAQGLTDGALKQKAFLLLGVLSTVIPLEDSNDR